MTAAEATALRDGDAEFAVRLLALLARSRQVVVLSPFSISETLAMLNAGARGETASQIASALDFCLPPARLHAAFNAADQALATVNGSNTTLDRANTLFGQRGERFRGPFLELLAHDYGAAMHTVNFASSPQSALSSINHWVQGHTHGEISDLLGPQDVDSLTRLVLVDAIYLHANWQLPFDRGTTALAPFHAPGGTVTVPMMHQTTQLGYLQAPGYRALELPYQGGRLAFDILLPGSGGLPALLARLDRSGPLRLLQGLRPTVVALSLPRLKLRTRFELKQALTELGMRLAFIPGAADLSGIAGPPGYLYVQAVAHEAYLRVDEAGTEAAAATGAVVGATSLEVAHIVFDVNHPFVFMLRDLKTGAILFAGAVSRP